MGELMESGYLLPNQCHYLREAYKNSLDTIRPNAVSLADAWGFSDFSLESSLGR